jgi:redox-sensitive bicupin YhaK (pirin superfamily)
MTAPKYRDLTADQLIESSTDEGAKVRAIAGETAGGRIKGPVEGLAVAPKFVDVTLEPGAGFRDTVPFDHTAFAYVDHGEIFFGPEKTPARGPVLVVFDEGEEVTATAGPEGGRFLLAAARPLHEPIARYGPFVMNTRAEIEQTLRELQTGRFLRRDPRDL